MFNPLMFLIMKIKCSIGVIVECIVFDDDTYQFMVRQPNGQPLAFVVDDGELGSLFSELRCNVIANSTLNSQSVNQE